MIRNALPTRRHWGACSHLLLRAGVALTSMAFAGLVGAVSIQTMLNSDHQACGALLDMVKAAHVPQMTDQQLCNFRFARLPPSVTTGFAFPVWTEMTVIDAPALYFKLLSSHLRPHGPSNLGYPWPDLMKGAQQASDDHNLIFSKAELQLEGKPPARTFVAMDTRRCSNQPYKGQIGFPFFGVFYQADLKEPEPVVAAPFLGAQIALWKKNIPVEIVVSDRWIATPGTPPTIRVVLEGLQKVPPKGQGLGYRDEYVYSYPVCDFKISRKSQPHVAKGSP